VKRRIIKYISFLAIILCIGIITGCSSGKAIVEETKNTTVKEQPEAGKNEIDSTKQEKVMKDVDYSKIYNGLNGCAVIFNPSENQYSVYNKSMCEVEVSPYSTFKIISALMGLKNGILTDVTSVMQYNGSKYPVNSWNNNLTLKEAFKTSCIWYFRQVIDAIGQEKVKSELQELHYGNGDISEWEGGNENKLQDLNGFWLNSSLKISPIEQVQILDKIFEGKSQFTDEQINILKSIMAFDDNKDCKIFGKTGFGTGGKAWYVGFSEENEGRVYFAVYLDDSKNKDSVSGDTARKIAVQIMN
jgi:bla regulator protein BlaR1